METGIREVHYRSIIWYRRKKLNSYWSFLKRNNGIASHFNWWFSIKIIRKWTHRREFVFLDINLPEWKTPSVFDEKRKMCSVGPQDVSARMRENETIPLRWNCSLWLKSCVSKAYKNRSPNFNSSSCLFFCYGRERKLNPSWKTNRNSNQRAEQKSNESVE